VAEKISAWRESGEPDEWSVPRKFARLNQCGTCVNQRPLVNEGEEVQPGAVPGRRSLDIQGELALGALPCLPRSCCGRATP